MTVYTFQFIALDSNGEQMPNAVGSFYGSSDTAFVTPIQVTAQDGTLTTTPTANRLGLVTFSYDGDDPRGYWKSGAQSIAVTANEAADTAAAAAVAAQAAAEAAAANTTAPTADVVTNVITTDLADPTTPIAAAVTASATTAAGPVADAKIIPIAPDGGVRAVGKGELVINIMDPAYGASPTATPAANTVAINAAMADAVAGGGHVYVPPFTFPTNGISSTLSGLTMYGAGRNLSKITSATGDVLTLAGGSVTFRNIGFRSLPSGGHTVVVAPGTTLSQSRFEMCNFTQDNDAKSVWYFNDTAGAGGGFFDDHWSDCLFQHKTTATVAGFFAYSNENNFFSANRFTRCRASNSGAWFFDIALDAAGTFNYNNTWDTINFEVCDGGGIRLHGFNNTGIHNIGFFDNDTITKNLIEIGRTGANNQSRGTRITNYHRSGGALSAGVVDILLASGQNAGTNTFEGISGTSTAGVTVDLGSGSGYAVVLGYDQTFVTILNANAARSVLITSDNGIQTPSLTINGVKYLAGTGAPEGVVTGTAGDMYTRLSGTGGVSSSRLYVKESGTATNTGWRAVNAPPAATTSQLTSAANVINTTGKVAGGSVWNSTLKRPVWAVGLATTDLWVFADGTTAHTPA